MLTRRFAPLAFVAALAMTTAAAHAAAQPTKVASVNLFRVYNDMQETKDLQVKLQNEANTLKAENQRRTAEIENLVNTRNQLKSDSPQYAEAQQKLLRAQIETETWGRSMQAELMHTQKTQMRTLFDKIRAAVADVAKQQGYDMVVTEQPVELGQLADNPQADANAMQRALANVNVLYTAPGNDITGQVLAALDAKYKSSGATPPTPTPAPAGGK